MHIYNCLTCSKIFQSVRGKWNPPKYCSTLCYSLSLKSQKALEHLSNARKKIIPKKRPEYVCLACSKIFYNKNKKRTPRYCCEKCFKSRIVSVDTKQKMSIAKIGFVPWNKGIEMWKYRTHPRGTLGMKGLNLGIKRSEQTRKNISEAHIGIKYPSKCNENHWNWKGGITEENIKIRKSSDYANWRRNVFKRDEFTCQICKKIGGRLHADHIKPFSTHHDLRLCLENGRTLCVECHRKTESYGAKGRTKQQQQEEKELL